MLPFPSRPFLGCIRWILTLLPWFFLASAFAQTTGESRLALLIGNAGYASSPLRNPVNDVRLMEQTLVQAGFVVTRAENVGRREMQRLVRDFGDRLKRDGGVGLFYFSGHGVQVKGANYLVPVDADIRAEDEVAYDSLDAQAVLEKMESAGNRVNLLILDACRNNPFATASRSASRGLAQMSAPSGTLVAYATSPGQVASDGTGRNSPYTRHLAAAMLEPGLQVEDVFKQVRTAVRRETGNAQTPWENTALEGRFFFLSPPQAAGVGGGPATPLPPASVNADVAFWSSIKDSAKPAELQSYLNTFPQGAFVALARTRLNESISQASGGAAWGTLQVRDDLTRRVERIELRQPLGKNRAAKLESGDFIDAEGRLTALRLSSTVVQVASGELWRIPPTGADRGEAALRVDGTDRLGSIRWQVRSDGAGGFAVVADVSLPIIGHVTHAARSGQWTATYLADVPVPLRSRLVLHASFAGGGMTPDFASTELTLPDGKPYRSTKR